LFVMLHGCTQDPNVFAAGTQMNKLADKHSFLVLYPIQLSSANLNKCWNWFEPAHQMRGSGEPNLIAGMTKAVQDQYLIDSSKVFVAGLSAGGAMACMMGALYPDVFRGVVIHAGLEFIAARDVNSAFTAMRQGGPNPVTQGNLAANAMKPHTSSATPMIVFQGTSDFTVYPVNGNQSVLQWITTNNQFLSGRLPSKPTETLHGTVPGGKSYSDEFFKDPSSGRTFVRAVFVTGMGHAWSGGSTAGSYTDPTGPDASTIMVNQFLSGGR